MKLSQLIKILQEMAEISEDLEVWVDDNGSGLGPVGGVELLPNLDGPVLHIYKSAPKQRSLFER